MELSSVRSLNAEICALILAAGTSSRAGAENKLLASIEGTPMARRVAEAILATGVGDVLVVLGHEADRVQSALIDLRLRFVRNEDYGDGMGTSLAVGARAFAGESYKGMLVCLADLPWLTPREVASVVEAFLREGSRRIVVPTFEGRRGHPVVFPIGYLAELGETKGDKGARKLIEREGFIEVAMPTSACIKDVDKLD